MPIFGRMRSLPRVRRCRLTSALRWSRWPVVSWRRRTIVRLRSRTILRGSTAIVGTRCSRFRSRCIVGSRIVGSGIVGTSVIGPPIIRTCILRSSIVGPSIVGTSVIWTGIAVRRTWPTVGLSGSARSWARDIPTGSIVVGSACPWLIVVLGGVSTRFRIVWSVGSGCACSSIRPAGLVRISRTRNSCAGAFRIVCRAIVLRCSRTIIRSRAIVVRLARTITRARFVVRG